MEPPYACYTHGYLWQWACSQQKASGDFDKLSCHYVGIDKGHSAAIRQATTLCCHLTKSQYSGSQRILISCTLTSSSSKQSPF